jgi:hypothetical protein
MALRQGESAWNAVSPVGCGAIRSDRTAGEAHAVSPSASAAAMA